MRRVTRVGGRVLLWLAVTLAVMRATLSLFELVVFGGTFGEESAAPVWLLATWLGVALAAGLGAAYACDRALVRRRERSRRHGR